MARKPRFNMPGYPQHVIQRGLDCQACFFTSTDYQDYLEMLRESAEKHACHVHAYVLMTNHIHLLVTPRQPFGVSHLMQRLGQCYTRRINRRYHRSGTLWEGRFKACLVDTEHYLLRCMRYIELNPVRAGIIEHPAGYAWSSYQCNGLGQPDAVIKPHPLYLQLGSGSDARLTGYRRLFDTHLGPDLLDAIRATLNQELVLGSDRFRVQIETMLDRQTTAKQKGRPRQMAGI